MTPTTDKEARRLSKAKVSLLRSPTFALLSGIMMVGKTTIDDNVPTAATNGRDEVYGRKWIAECSDKELAFTVAHENYHKMYRHLTVWRKLWNIDKQLANIACDHVINVQLYDLDPSENLIAHPRRKGERVGCFDERFRGMSAKQVFDILRKEQENGGKGGKGDGSGAGEPMDDHDWEGAGDMSEAEQRELERELDQAIRQGQIAAKKACGTGNGNLPRELEDLLHPKVDWRAALRDFVSATCAGRDFSSWRRPNRRFISEDIYMPSLTGERVGRVAVGCDTSGSISVAEHTRNLSELQSILDTVKPEVIDLIYWDSRVAGHETYDDGNRDTFLRSTKPVGGGGTDPTSMMHYLKEKKIEPECIIMFTDGYIGSWGSEWGCPILWVVCGSNGKIMAPVGQTIHIDE